MSCRVYGQSRVWFELVFVVLLMRVRGENNALTSLPTYPVNGLPLYAPSVFDHILA